MILKAVDELQADNEEIAYIDELALFYFCWTYISLDVLTIYSRFCQFYQLEEVLPYSLVKSLVCAV